MRRWIGRERWKRILRERDTEKKKMCMPEFVCVCVVRYESRRRNIPPEAGGRDEGTKEKEDKAEREK
jgi:hypothetical protein